MHTQVAEDQLLKPPQVVVHSFDTAVNFQAAKPRDELYTVVGFSEVACYLGKFQRDVELVALSEARHCLGEDKVLARAM